MNMFIEHFWWAMELVVDIQRQQHRRKTQPKTLNLFITCHPCGFAVEGIVHELRHGSFSSIRSFSAVRAR